MEKELKRKRILDEDEEDKEHDRIEKKEQIGPENRAKRLNEDKEYVDEHDKELDSWIEKKEQIRQENRAKRLNEYKEYVVGAIRAWQPEIMIKIKKVAEEEGVENSHFWSQVSMRVKMLIEGEVELEVGMSLPETIRRVRNKIGGIIVEERKRLGMPLYVNCLGKIMPHFVGPHVETRNQMSTNQSYEYDGFDIRPSSSTIRLSKVGGFAPYNITKYSESLLEDLSILALKTYNKNNKKGRSMFVYDSVVKANYQAVAGRIFYITFKASDFYGNCKTFRAEVWEKISSPPHVYSCEMW